jgi:hypothetical protein
MNPLPGETPKDFLRRIVNELGEHFDVVQIFAQVDDPESTKSYHGGVGNMFAIAKQMEVFLDEWEAQHIPMQDVDSDDDSED